MNARLQLAFVRSVLIVFGAAHALLGLTQLFAPAWFWQNIGNFSPFNRHYVGDLGSFQVPLGLALLWAVRNPYANRVIVACAIGADLIHALNHVNDDLLAGTGLSAQTLFLMLDSILFALVLLPLSRAVIRQPARATTAETGQSSYDARVRGSDET